MTDTELIKVPRDLCVRQPLHLMHYAVKPNLRGEIHVCVTITHVQTRLIRT